MLATLAKTSKRSIRLFSTTQQPQQVDAYFTKLDTLAQGRNETDQAYTEYTKHLDQYKVLVQSLQGDLVHKSLQRISDHVIKNKAPLSSLLHSLNACFDSQTIQGDLKKVFSEEL